MRKNDKNTVAAYSVARRRRAYGGTVALYHRVSKTHSSTSHAIIGARIRTNSPWKKQYGQSTTPHPHLPPIQGCAHHSPHLPPYSHSLRPSPGAAPQGNAQHSYRRGAQTHGATRRRRRARRWRGRRTQRTRVSGCAIRGRRCRCR